MAKLKVYDRTEEIKKLVGATGEFVYVITNSTMPGLVKLGATTDIRQRYFRLASVLPGVTSCRWYCRVEGMFEIERRARKRLREFSVQNSQDWFSCPVHVVTRAFDQVIRNLEHKLIDGESFKFKSDPIKVESLKDLGQYCRRWRKQNRVTIGDMASMTGLGVRFISEFERGKPTCQFDLCMKICSFIGVDVYAAKRKKD